MWFGGWVDGWMDGWMDGKPIGLYMSSVLRKIVYLIRGFF